MSTVSPELEKFDRHISYWFLWKVATPYVLMMAVWPIYRYIMGVPDAFGRAFAHGELLIFAALVLIEVSLEGTEARDRDVSSFGGRAVALFLEALKSVALLIIFFVGFMKFDVMKLESAPNPSKLVAYSCLSCSVAMLAVALSLFGVIRAMKATATSQLEARGVHGR